MLMRACYLDYEQSGDELIVRVAGRDENGERRKRYVTGTRPYLFVPADEPVPDDPRILSDEDGYEGFDGKPLTKLELSHPQDTEEIKEQFSESYESDIPYYRRKALDGLIGHIDVPPIGGKVDITDIDTDPTVDDPIEPRIVIGDIEVLPSEGSVPIEEMKQKAKQPVIAATFWDSYDDEYSIIGLDPDEEINKTTVKHYLDDHWPEEYSDEYVHADFEFTRCETIGGMWNTIVYYFQSKQPDVVGGWNWVDFDWEYLLNWAKSTGPDAQSHHAISDLGSVGGYETERIVDGLPAFDMMDAFTEKMTWTNWRSKALDYVADEELGVGKVDDIDIRESWEGNPSRLLAYNIIDTQLCVALERKHEIFDFFFNLGDLSSIPIYDTFSELRLVDGYIMSRRGDDEVLPEAEDKELVENAGALVLDPTEGIEDWVGTFDVKSLYPSAIITCNISPETKDGGDVIIPAMPEHADDVGGEIQEGDINWREPMVTFGLEQEGIVPKYIKQIFERRDEFKDLRDEYEPGSVEYEKYDTRQYAVKVIQNSFYGVMSSDYWRLAVDGLGDAVTGAGRYVLWSGAEMMREVGYDILAGDTDSVITSLQHEDGEELNMKAVLLRGSGIETQLNDRMDTVATDLGIPDEHPFISGGGLHGTDRHCFFWEFEKLYRRFLMSGSKKRYAGRIVWKEGKETDDIDITGFEYRRSDVPEVVADAQKETIRLLLQGEDFEVVSETVQGFIDDLKHDFEPRTYALPGTINQPIDDYPNRPVKRAVRYSNEHLPYDFRVGGDPWLIPVRETPPDKPPTDYIAIEWTDDVPEGFEVNYTKLIEKCYQQPLEPILEVAGWSWREVKTGRRTQGLGGGGSTENPFADDDGDDGSAGGIHSW